MEDGSDLQAVKRSSILIVDDTPDNLTLLSGILKDQYQVRAARSGEKALQMLGAESLPDLILLDVMMPEMDGFELLRRIKENPKTAEIPVIFVTAASDNVNEEHGFLVGAVDYLTKPVVPAIVRARVRSHLAITEQNRTLRDLSVKLSRYLAPQVYQSIFKGVQDTSIHAKRKKLTIFFSDLKDFTSTTAELEPEDLAYLLNKYFEEMSKIALDYGATIDKFIGDAMLMFFGDPDTMGVKEDALRCVRMAISMQRRMTDLQDLWRDKGFQKPLQMRIGINTGFCHVGNFGSSQRMDYTVIGSEVNLAARLEAAGETNGIQLSHETWALVKEEVQSEEMPPLTLKGIAQPVRNFRVTGIHDGPEVARRFVSKAQPGFRATLDLDRLAPASREDAVKDLEELIARIRAHGS